MSDKRYNDPYSPEEYARAALSQAHWIALEKQSYGAEEIYKRLVKATERCYGEGAIPY